MNLKKNIFLILFLCFWTQCLIAQPKDCPNLKDSLGRKQGCWVTYKDINFNEIPWFDSCYYYSTIYYLNDSIVGMSYEYFKNGQIHEKVKLTQEENYDSTYVRYHANGKIREIETYKNGTKDGLFKYFNENGEEIMNGVYQNDTLERGFKIKKYSATIYYKLGDDSYEKNDYIKAEKFYMKAIKEYQLKNDLESQLEIANIYYFIGSIYRDEHEKRSQAIIWFTKAQDYFRKTEGSNGFDVIKIYKDIAICQVDVKQFEEAIKNYTIVYNQSLQLKGENSSDIYNIELRIAHLYTNFKKYALADSIFKKLKTKQNIVYDNTDEEYYTLFNYLSLHFHGRGLLDSAMYYSKKYIDGLEFVKAKEYDLALAYNNISMDLKNYGNIIEAELYALRAVHLYTAVYEKQHEVRLDAIIHLAKIKKLLGKPQEAKELYEEVKKYVDKESNLYLELLYDLAMLEKEAGDFEEAEELLLQRHSEILSGKFPDSDEFASQRDLGIFYGETYQFEKAKAYFNKALTEVKNKSNSENISLSYWDLAWLSGLENKYEDALNYYQLALHVHTTSSGIHNERYLKILNNTIDFHSKIHNYTKANELRKYVYKHASKVLGIAHPTSITYLKNISSEFLDNYQFDSAAYYLRKEDTIIYQKHSKSSLEYGYILLRWAKYNRELRDYKMSEKYYLQYLELVKSLVKETQDEYHDALYELGYFYYVIDKYDKSEYFLKQCLLLKSQKYRSNSIYLDNINLHLARLYETKRNFDQSKFYYEKVLSYKQIKHGKESYEYAKSQNEYADLLMKYQHYDEAETIYQNTLKTTENLFGKNSAKTINAKASLASLYEELGEFEKALKIRKEALQFNLNFKSARRYLAINYRDLGHLYFDYEKYDSAFYYFSKSFEIRKSLFGPNNISTQWAYENIGKTYQKLGKYELAEKYLSKSLYFTDSILGKNNKDYLVTAKLLSNYYLETGNYLGAANLYKEIMGIRNILEEEKKLDHFEDESFYIWSCFKLHSSNNLAIGLYQVADYFIDHFELITKGFTENEKKSFYYNKKYLIDRALVALAKYPEESKKLYHLAVESKNLLFSHSKQLNENILHSNDEKLILKLSKLNSLKEKLVFYQELQGIDSLKVLLSDSIYTIEKEITSKVLLRKDKNIEETVWKKVKSELKKGEVLVEIVRLKENILFGKDSISYLALIISKETIKSPKVVLLKDGEKMEKQYYKYYSNHIKHNEIDESSFLYYWENIQKNIPLGSKKIYFIPDGIYHQINIKTLFNTSSKNYLLDEYEIKQIGSSKDLIFPPKPISKRKIACLMGNPDFYYGEKKNSNDLENNTTRNVKIGSKQQILPLPNTEIEVTKISSILTDNLWDIKTYTGENCTENRIKNLDNPRILHISTHGFFDNDAKSTHKQNYNPLSHSGLLLSGAGKYIELDSESKRAIKKSEDGLLTAIEALNIKLDSTELVVLSACETGLGEISNGDGIYGLQRSFQIAGANNLIISLWKVNDKATQELMTEFYKNWIENKNISKSFRLAQQYIKNKYSHPYYWGAFVMIE